MLAEATRLADLVVLHRGATYKSRLLDEPGPALLGLASIAPNGGFRPDSLRTYGGESPEALLLRPGDLYVALKDVTQSGDVLGAVARVPEYVSVGRLTQDTVKLVVAGDEEVRGYIYWLLRTPQFRDYCRAHAIGTTNLSLSRDDFLAFPVPAADAERLSLVRVLEALDDKIELNRRMNVTLEAIARTAFNDLVRKDSRLVRLSEVAGVNALTIGRDYPHDPIEYVDISSVSPGRIEATTTYERDEAPSRAQRLVRDGDVIWSCVRPNRRSYALVQDPAPNLVVSTGFVVLTPHAVPPSFLYMAVTSEEFVDYLTSNADGSAYPAVRPSHFEAAGVPLTSEKSLREFDDLAAPLFRRRGLNERESRTLAALRDTLLPKLISGELRVRDAVQVADQPGR